MSTEFMIEVGDTCAVLANYIGNRDCGSLSQLDFISRDPNGNEPLCVNNGGWWHEDNVGLVPEDFAYYACKSNTVSSSNKSQGGLNDFIIPSVVISGGIIGSLYTFYRCHTRLARGLLR